MDFGYLAWRRAIRTGELSVRGPRTNKGLQARLKRREAALYVLSPEELLALLYAHRWSPVHKERVDAIREYTPDKPPTPLAKNHRVRMPSLARQMELAQLSQESSDWGLQRMRSNGSSGAGGASGWSFSDVYHLKVDEMRGLLGAPGFDPNTQYNFLHGHHREDMIRKPLEIVMGSWVGETGMLLHRDVWCHDPARRGQDQRKATGKGKGDGKRRRKTLRSGKLSLGKCGRVSVVRGPTHKSKRSSERPDGHKHTSPDGVCVLTRGVYHNKYMLRALKRGEISRKGLVEIKAPGFVLMGNRGRRYTSRGWQQKELVPQHLPIYYYAPQLVDQQSVVGSWCGTKDVQWNDFVPMWTAHGRSPPRPFFFTHEVLRDRDLQSSHPSLSERWFVDRVTDRRGATPQVWVTGEMLVTRVMRNARMEETMAHFYYSYYKDIHGTHKVKNMHHEKLLDSVTGEELPMVYVPLKQVVWLIHPTPETPPVPCEWALNEYGPTPEPHQVQVVTRPLTRHDTDFPCPPHGWPTTQGQRPAGKSKSKPENGYPKSDLQPFPLDPHFPRAWGVHPSSDAPMGYMSVYVIHFWDEKPRSNTIAEMSVLK